MSENVAGQVGNVIISDAKVSSGNTGISLLQSSPGSVKFHRIEDRELEAMVNMNSPLTFGICTTAAGAFLGLIPSVVSIFSTIYKVQPITTIDAILLIIAVACLVTAIVTGIFARKGFTQSRDMLTTIRQRPLTPV